MKIFKISLDNVRYDYWYGAVVACESKEKLESIIKCFCDYDDWVRDYDGVSFFDMPNVKKNYVRIMWLDEFNIKEDQCYTIEEIGTTDKYDNVDAVVILSSFNAG